MSETRVVLAKLTADTSQFRRETQAAMGELTKQVGGVQTLLASPVFKNAAKDLTEGLTGSSAAAGVLGKTLEGALMGFALGGPKVAVLLGGLSAITSAIREIAKMGDDTSAKALANAQAEADAARKLAAAKVEANNRAHAAYMAQMERERAAEEKFRQQRLENIEAINQELRSMQPAVGQALQKDLLQQAESTLAPSERRARERVREIEREYANRLKELEALRQKAILENATGPEGDAQPWLTQRRLEADRDRENALRVVEANRVADAMREREEAFERMRERVREQQERTDAEQARRRAEERMRARRAADDAEDQRAAARIDALRRAADEIRPGQAGVSSRESIAASIQAAISEQQSPQMQAVKALQRLIELAEQQRVEERRKRSLRVEEGV